MPTLTVYSSSAGTAQYSAGVFPLEGAVPSGSVVVSDDDASLRSSVLSRWPDGSASVVVVSGETAVTAGSSRAIRLRSGAAAGTALTAARVGQLVTEVNVSLGTLGSAVITNFASPNKVWWANERVICCRYRVPVGSDASLEAIIDIHAYAGARAFVEVVVENGKIAAASSAPSKPASKSYTASVRVNGNVAATVSSSSGPNGSHEAFRAWYASYWVGGDPGVEVTQDAASMQAHPLLFRVWKPAADLSSYANDAYAAWGVGRHPASNMAAGGDSAQIGPLPLWECQYLQSGDRSARRAVIASALSMLSFNINYRDSTSGLVPSLSAIHPKRMSGVQDWPTTATEPSIDGGAAHHGAAGLMAFACRPSPVFIEIAQKLATWNGSNWSTTGEFSTDYQQRGYAWCMRSLGHAIFLTPDGEDWKAAAKADLYKNVQRGLSFKNSPLNKLDFIWDDTLGSPYDFESDAGMQQPTFMVAYQITEIPKIANAKLLSGTQQADFVALADWICKFPVRFVNEAVSGEWRAVGASRLTVSSSASAFVESNWGAVQAFQYSGSSSPPPASGMWLEGRGVNTYAALYQQTTAGANYSSYFWAALAIAVERDIPGAAAAWTKVNAGVSNMATWSDGFRADPRWGVYPRNK